MTSKRIQILQAIQSGAVTLDEIAERIDQPSTNLRDNLKACVTDGLLEKFRDDVTGLPAYKLTKAGQARLEQEAKTKTTTTQAGSGDITPAAAHRATSLAPNSGEGAAVNEPPPPVPVVKDSLTTEKPVAVRSDDEPQNLEQRAIALAVRNHNIVAEICQVVGFPDNKPMTTLGEFITEKISQATQPTGDMPTDKECCNAAKVVATTAGDVVVRLNNKINQQATLIANLNDQIDALSHNAPVITDRFIVTDSYVIVKTESDANKTALRMAQEIECDSPVIVFAPIKARELRINWRDA